MALPWDERLVGAGDVEDVALELAFLDGLIAGVDAQPVPVAYPVDAVLGLGVPSIGWDDVLVCESNDKKMKIIHTNNNNGGGWADLEST